ncbi:hypothetical protein N7476_000596 [Penicillium atrosanguineum]|uniref:Mso1 N-terminal domain-containing protein n=1 Tax=Penicillium atrosanguineum TaxID=1132637 RepID=A0A9W9UCA9_9EURO|nr:hypothetical protein N7476_000596 [Penicillium atrosanguineum]
MSSYFSSFTGSSSSLSSALGSRLTSLRRAITLGDEGDDPENEDGSHISNALRAYYTEKGRPFPSWLPPDPKAPQAASNRVVATSQLPQGQGPATVSYSRGGGLGDLWGDSGASQPAGAQTASLRRGRVGNAPPLLPMNSAPPGPVSTPSPPLQHAHSHSPGPPGVCIRKEHGHYLVSDLDRTSQPGPRACRKTGRGRHKSDCGHGFRGAGLRALMSIRV